MARRFCDGLGRKQVVRVVLHALEAVRYEDLLKAFTAAYTELVVVHKSENRDVIELTPPHGSADGWCAFVSDALRNLGFNAVIAPEWPIDARIGKGRA